MKQLIVGLGEALWDCLPEGRKLGGAPANFAYHTGLSEMMLWVKKPSMNSIKKV